jgi:transposase
LGVFDSIFSNLAAKGTEAGVLIIDATRLKAHRTSASLLKGALSWRIGRTKGGLNSNLHFVTDGKGTTIILLLIEGQLSDHTGAMLIYLMLPDAKVLIGDKGYDSDECCAALKARKINLCIPPRSNRNNPRSYSKTLYKQRNLVERMFAKLKDWRRIATRYDRCAHTLFLSICIAATIIFWFNQW